MEPGLRAGRDGAAAAAAGGRGHRGPAGGHRGAARAALRGRAGRHGRGGLRARLRRAADAGGRVQPCLAMILFILVWSGGGRGRGAAGRPAGRLPRPGAAGGGRHAGVRPGRQVDSGRHHAAPRHQETRRGVSSAAAGINNKQVTCYSKDVYNSS